jgi:hypothetical protein
MSSHLVHPDSSADSVPDHVADHPPAAETSSADRPHAAMRGIVYGVLFAVPFWALLAILLYLAI